MTKEDLKKLAFLNERLRSLEWQKKQLRDAASGCTRRLTGMPAGSAVYDRLAAYAAKLDELDTLYAELLCSLGELRLRLETALAELPAQQERVLRLRYVEGLSWRRVSCRLHYSEPHLRRIHDAALRRLEKQV